MNNLILVRHGQSLWNKEKRFTGWADIDLTEQGIAEAEIERARLANIGQAQAQAMWVWEVSRAGGQWTTPRWKTACPPGMDHPQLPNHLKIIWKY